MAHKETHITNESMKKTKVLYEVGEHIRSWAENPASRPSEEDAYKLLKKAGVKFRGRVKKIQFQELKEDTFVVMLPQPGQIERVVDAIKENGKKYNLPTAISEFVESPPGDNDAVAKEVFYLIRLADYTLQHCGGD